MTCNEDEHEDWIDEFWGIVQNALLAVGTFAAIAGLAGIVYGLGTR